MTTNGKRGDEEERSEVSSLKKTKRKASKQEKKVQMGTRGGVYPGGVTLLGCRIRGTP